MHSPDAQCREQADRDHCQDGGADEWRRSNTRCVQGAMPVVRDVREKHGRESGKHDPERGRESEGRATSMAGRRSQLHACKDEDRGDEKLKMHRGSSLRRMVIGFVPKCLGGAIGASKYRRQTSTTRHSGQFDT